MASVNKVFLIGNLTRDPELRYTPNGAAVTDLGLAVNRVYNTKDGDRREETLFIDVTVWNRQAENCCQYLRKGRPVHVEGFLKMDSWDDKTTGEKRTKIKVEADRVQFLDSRRDDATGGGPPAHDEDYAPPPAREPRRGPAPAGPEPRGGGNGPARSYGSSPAPPPSRRPAAPPEEGDDDIPF
jgi:single-strand DNA-binding protein